jgi:asparaginyl-tRNA synthetase
MATQTIRVAVARHAKSAIGKAVSISGWIRTMRKQGKITFLEVNDGSSLNNMQIVANFDIGDVNYNENSSKKISVGSCVKIQGNLVEGPKSHGELELQLLNKNDLKLLGTCDTTTYPLQKKYHSVEFLREILHLRPRSNTAGAVLRVRSQLARGIRNFFHERDFLEVNTPILTSNDCEGAGEMFEILQSHPTGNNSSNNNKYDFFNNPTYLTVSGQLHAEIFANSMTNVYTFGPTFRAENSNTSRHLAEFWMIEPEIAFADLQDAMSLAENCLKYSIEHILEECTEDIDFFNKRLDKNTMTRLTTTIDKPFQYISYTDAIDILKTDIATKKNINFEYNDIHWGMNLQSEHEKYLSEVVFNGTPTIIHHYPTTIKPFYMKQSREHDGSTVEAFDLVVPKIGELIGGSAREDDYFKLKQAMLQHDLIVDKGDSELQWYLDLRKYGSAPHAGFGLGFERLLQYISGIANIRDVIPIPRSKSNCSM